MELSERKAKRVGATNIMFPQTSKLFYTLLTFTGLKDKSFLLYMKKIFRLYIALNVSKRFTDIL